MVTFDANQMSVDELITMLEKTGKGPRLVDDEITATQRAPLTIAPPEVTAARERAMAENRLLILDFSATWCGPCQRLLKETFVDTKVQRLLEGAELVTVDADEAAEFANSQNVSLLPDIRFFAPDGTQIGQVNEFVDAEQFAEILKKHLEAIAGR